ncbi:MAG: zinc ribbon domain-containing protein, partial [Paenibacillus macerans]|nr:zinc ribbon domain-containing protein [Paenibacillus macerans]
MEARYCSSCGQRTSTTARFCENCGKPLEHQAYRQKANQQQINQQQTHQGRTYQLQAPTWKNHQSNSN